MNTPIQRNVYNTSVGNTNTPMNVPKRRGRPPGSGKSNSKYNNQNNYKKTYNDSRRKGKSKSDYSGSSDDFSDNFDETTSEEDKKDFSNEDDWEEFVANSTVKTPTERPFYSGKKRGRKPKNHNLITDNKDSGSYRVFDTELANAAAEAVSNNIVASIIEFHKSKGLNEITKSHGTVTNIKSVSKNNNTLPTPVLSKVFSNRPIVNNFVSEQKSDSRIKGALYDNNHSIPTNLSTRPVNNIPQTQTPVGFAPSSLGSNTMFNSNNHIAAKPYFDMSSNKNLFSQQHLLKNCSEIPNMMSHSLNDQLYYQSNAVYVPNNFHNTGLNAFNNNPQNNFINNVSGPMKPMNNSLSNVPSSLLNVKRPYMPIGSPSSMNQPAFSNFVQTTVNRPGYIQQQHTVNSTSPLTVMSVNASANIGLETNCSNTANNQ